MTVGNTGGLGVDINRGVYEASSGSLWSVSEVGREMTTESDVRVIPTLEEAKDLAYVVVDVTNDFLRSHRDPIVLAGLSMVGALYAKKGKPVLPRAISAFGSAASGLFAAGAIFAERDQKRA